MDKTILHCDLNNFYASVECLNNKELSTLPLIVCGNPTNRHGIVLAKNNIAKKCGVKTGDPIWQARSKCENLVCVLPSFDQYQYYSNKIRQIYYKYTNCVEPYGLDECWLDVTGSEKIYGNGEAIANLIREEVKSVLGLTISVGVSFTKTFAKLGSDLKKPDAVTVISRENYKRVVWSLPVDEFFMVGKKTAEKLNKVNVYTIGDLATMSDVLLKKMLGINGIALKNNANGISEQLVCVATESTPIKSVGHGITTKEDVDNFEDAKGIIYYLSDMVASRLRKYGLIALGISCSAKNCELKTEGMQFTLFAPTCTSSEIANEAFSLLTQFHSFEKRGNIRAISISAFNLLSAKEQLQQSFFDDKDAEKKYKLDLSLDKIKNRFGNGSIKRANLIESKYITLDVLNNEDVLPFNRKNFEEDYEIVDD